MPRAQVMLRAQPLYRRESFEAGLERNGWMVCQRIGEPAPEDVLVIWNRYGIFDVEARRFEQSGAQVLVAENGFIGLDEQGRQYYSMAMNRHNGAGWWAVGETDRWEKLGVELKPWRRSGDHIVVVGQRGIGIAPMASPRGWHETTAARLRALTKRPVIVREHPGKPAVDPGVTEDFKALLRGAHACVIWSSANGVRALVEGIPVIYAAPNWVMSPAASDRLDAIEDPPTPDRNEAFRRMAWAQWSVAEIERGEPFQYLLRKR